MAKPGGSDSNRAGRLSRVARGRLINTHNLVPKRFKNLQNHQRAEVPISKLEISYLTVHGP